MRTCDIWKKGHDSRYWTQDTPWLHRPCCQIWGPVYRLSGGVLQSVVLRHKDWRAVWRPGFLFVNGHLKMNHNSKVTINQMLLNYFILHLKAQILIDWSFRKSTFSGGLDEASWDRPLRSGSHPCSSLSSCCFSSLSGFHCSVEGLCCLVLPSSCASGSLRFSNLWLQSLKPSSSSRTRRQLGFSSSSDLIMNSGK